VYIQNTVRDHTSPQNTQVITAKLNLVDLGGSERYQWAHTEDTNKETVAINQSLSSLAGCATHTRTYNTHTHIHTHTHTHTHKYTHAHTHIHTHTHTHTHTHIHIHIHIGASARLLVGKKTNMFRTLSSLA
jgi:hypothetical protein